MTNDSKKPADISVRANNDFTQEVENGHIGVDQDNDHDSIALTKNNINIYKISSKDTDKPLEIIVWDYVKHLAYVI